MGYGDFEEVSGSAGEGGGGGGRIGLGKDVEMLE